MTLLAKTISGKKYYYSQLVYSISGKTKGFSKYIGAKKPSEAKLAKIEENFRTELIERLSGKHFSTENASKDDFIKALLFNSAFRKKFDSLTKVQKQNFETEQTILFTLTTLTTEDVDVSLADVQNALTKKHDFSLREKISNNMVKAVQEIGEGKRLDENYLLKLHKMAMAEFETKTPGQFRNKQVYLHKADKDNPLGSEIAYRPPNFAEIPKLAKEFSDWYNSTSLNPLEKASQAHTRIYRIHPFLDGNKRICRLIFNKTLVDNGFPLLNISEKKEHYFQALIESTEKKNPKQFTEFALSEYFRQVKRFLKKGFN